MGRWWCIYGDVSGGVWGALWWSAHILKHQRLWMAGRSALNGLLVICGIVCGVCDGGLVGSCGVFCGRALSMLCRCLWMACMGHLQVFVACGWCPLAGHFACAGRAIVACLVDDLTDHLANHW